VSLLRCTDDSNKIKYYENIVDKSQAELKKYKDKEGYLHSQVATMSAENVKYLLELETKDEALIKLQNLVKANKSNLKQPGSSASIIEEEINIEAKFPIIETVTDSIYPEYKYAISLKDKDGLEWVKGSVVANKDSVSLNQSIINEYSVVIGSMSQGLFKKRLRYVDVYNKNPYSDIKVVKTLEVTEKQRNFGVGFNISYGIGRDFTPTPYVGFGINYNLIKKLIII
jgi:hypothetical protein